MSSPTKDMGKRTGGTQHTGGTSANTGQFEAETCLLSRH
jgi:hypothetical protein